MAANLSLSFLHQPLLNYNCDFSLLMKNILDKNMKASIGVLLINLGTPDSPSVGDVRKYLFEFLNDPRVIDLPSIARFPGRRM